MKDIQSTLRAGDPVAREGGASSDASERMRHRVRSEIRDVKPARRRPFLTLAVVGLLLAVGAAWMTNRALRPQPSAKPLPDSVADARERPESRQLQFFTPGGTRVLWTLHPKLETR
jgi:hypothetical protein